MIDRSEPKRARSKIILVCEKCGQPFIPRKNRETIARFCSRLCVQKCNGEKTSKKLPITNNALNKNLRHRAYKTVEHKLKKRPCEICGKPNACAHHIDYADALNVRWLCRAHHALFHLGLIKLP